MLAEGKKKGWMVMAADYHFALSRDPETLNQGPKEFGRRPRITLRYLSQVMER